MKRFWLAAIVALFVVSSASAQVVTGPATAGTTIKGNPIGIGMKDGSGNIEWWLGGATGIGAVNIAQVNGVTTTMGNGVAGTGVQRVTIASDSTGIIGVSNAAVVLQASGTITSPGTVTGTAVTGLGFYKQIQVVLAVTAAALAVDDTMDVYIDTSPDGGTTWYNAIHFPQVLGNGGVKSFFATLDPAGAAGTACVNTTSDAAVNTVRPSIFTDRLRVRTVNVDGVVPGAESFTFSVKAYAKS